MTERQREKNWVQVCVTVAQIQHCRSFCVDFTPCTFSFTIIFGFYVNLFITPTIPRIVIFIHFFVTFRIFVFPERGENDDRSRLKDSEMVVENNLIFVLCNDISLYGNKDVIQRDKCWVLICARISPKMVKWIFEKKKYQNFLKEGCRSDNLDVQTMC